MSLTRRTHVVTVDPSRTNIEVHMDTQLIVTTHRCVLCRQTFTHTPAFVTADGPVCSIVCAPTEAPFENACEVSND